MMSAATNYSTKDVGISPVVIPEHTGRDGGQRTLPLRLLLGALSVRW
jgi:hypothetical protein